MNNRRRAILITLIIGAVLAAVCLLVIQPINPLAGPLEQLVIWLVAWLGLSLLLWSLRDLAEVTRDVADLWRPQRPRALARAAVHETARATEQAAFAEAASDIPKASQDEIRAVVTTLARYGVFAPQVPDPALLFAGTPDFGGGVTPDGIFYALNELHYYHPDIDTAEFMANLAFVDSKTEQSAALIHGYINEFDALTDGALGIQIVRIDHPSFADMAARDVVIDLTVGGAPLRIQYRGLPKYLSTHLHVALARAYHALGRGDAIASYWTDQGAWLMRIAHGAVERLNAALGIEDSETADPFAWLHEEVPFAAGSISLPQP